MKGRDFEMWEETRLNKEVQMRENGSCLYATANEVWTENAPRSGWEVVRRGRLEMPTPGRKSRVNWRVFARENVAKLIWTNT